MVVVGGLIAVDLIENPLQRRGRHAVHHIDERVGLMRPDLLDDLVGQPVKLRRAVFEQRVDGDLAVEPLDIVLRSQVRGLGVGGQRSGAVRGEAAGVRAMPLTFVLAGETVRLEQGIEHAGDRPVETARVRSLEAAHGRHLELAGDGSLEGTGDRPVETACVRPAEISRGRPAETARGWPVETGDRPLEGPGDGPLIASVGAAVTRVVIVSVSAGAAVPAGLVRVSALAAPGVQAK